MSLDSPPTRLVADPNRFLSLIYIDHVRFNVFPLGVIVFLVLLLR